MTHSRALKKKTQYSVNMLYYNVLEFRGVSSLVHLKIWTPTKVQIQSKKFLQDSNICLDTVTAGNQVIIRFRPRRLAPREPLTHTSVQVSVLCWIFLPQVKVTTTHSVSLSPSPRLAQCVGKEERRIISRSSSLDRLTNQLLSSLMSWATILLHHVKTSLFFSLFFFLFHPHFFSPKPK